MDPSMLLCRSELCSVLSRPLAQFTLLVSLWHIRLEKIWCNPVKVQVFDHGGSIFFGGVERLPAFISLLQISIVIFIDGLFVDNLESR